MNLLKIFKKCKHEVRISENKVSSHLDQNLNWRDVDCSKCNKLFCIVSYSSKEDPKLKFIFVED